MRTLILITFYFLSLGTVHGFEHCKEIKDVEGKYYWFNNIVYGTSIVEDSKEVRTWFVNSDPFKCYKSRQTEINNPGTIYTGHIMALKELGDDFNSKSKEKIKQITGLSFRDSNQFKNWFNMNSNNFFWSFEKNKIIVLKNGFRCKKITPAGGKLYWFNYSLGSVNDMDTSFDKRLWSDKIDNTKCFISPLSEINDQNIQFQGFRLALLHVGNKNDDFRQQIVNRYKRLENNDALLLKELINTN